MAIIGPGVALLIAGVGGAVGYGLLRGRVQAQEANIARLDAEITRLHQRSNRNKDNLAAVQLQIANDLADIKNCITRLETLLTEHIKHEHGDD